MGYTGGIPTKQKNTYEWKNTLNPKCIEDCAKESLFKLQKYWPITDQSIEYIKATDENISYDTCVRCCTSSQTLKKWKTMSYSPSSFKNIKSCSKVYFCTRPLKGFTDHQDLHRFLWLDANCDYKCNLQEFIGWGGPPDYKPSIYGPWTMPADVDAYRSGKVRCLDTNCNPKCIAMFIDAYFGKGKCFDPTAEKKKFGCVLQGAGGYAGTNSERNCWGFVNKAFEECNCEKVR